MIYKKNTRIVYNTNNIVIRLSVECDGRQISAIAYDGDVEIESIISVVHNLNALNESLCYEVIGVSAVNDLDIMCRLQQFFYNSLHGLGIRCFWFEKKNNKLIEFANMLYTLNRIQGTDYYYADLNRMYFHNNEQPNQ